MRAKKNELKRLKLVNRATRAAAVSAGLSSRGVTKGKGIDRANTFTIRVLGRRLVRLPMLVSTIIAENGGPSRYHDRGMTLTIDAGLCRRGSIGP
jgi:hypothetical protein